MRSWPLLAAVWGLSKELFIGGTERAWIPLTELDADPALDVGGTIDIRVTYKGSELSNNTFLVVLTRGQWSSWEGTRVFRLDRGRLNTYLQADWRQTMCCSGEIRVNRTITRGPERFRAGILNVDQKALEIRASIVMRQANGSLASYEETPLPRVYWLLFLAESFACGVYACMIATWWQRQRSALHLLYIVALASRAANVLALSKAAEARAAGFSAGALETWGLGVVSNVVDIVGLAAYMVTALGWKTMRPSLYPGEIRFLAAIAVASLYFGVFEIACTGQECGMYVLSKLILQSLAYLCIIVAFNFNLAMLRTQITEANVGRDVGRLYSHKRAYTTFRWIFLLFLIQPTALMFIRVSVLSWEEGWVHSMLEEMVRWGLLLATAIVYSPRRQHFGLFEQALDPPEER
jgi:hypothetical protein